MFYKKFSEANQVRNEIGYWIDGLYASGKRKKNLYIYAY